MSKKELPISDLKDFLPPETYERVLEYLNHYHVHLTVARARKSILGDYRHRSHNNNHRISVNGNLNKYAFLITLLHEMAHLLTFERFGNRVAAHGKEWKIIFGQLLAQFIEMNVFPEKIQATLLRSIQNPPATSCADEMLLRVLKNFDEKYSEQVFIETVPAGAFFRTHDGKLFRKGEKIRKRFRCEEIKTKKIYLFSPVYEVRIENSTD